MQTYYFESMYREVAQNDRYSQIPFYELGRNFWFWSPQLEFKPPEQDPVITGFAVWMRFRSMAAAGVNGAPFNGVPFSTFASQVAASRDQFAAFILINCSERVDVAVHVNVKSQAYR